MDGADIHVETIIAVIYGPPNYGKTTLALSSSNPILLDFDKGAYRSGNKAGKAIVPVSAWSDVASIAADDIQDFDTIIIDTVGTCLDFITEDIIRTNKKASVGGALSLNGYGILKSRFREFLSRLLTMGKDVILVAHLKEDQRGDEVVERIVATGASRDEVYQEADIMGRISLDGRDRFITFDPTVTSYAKNVGLSDYSIPDPSESDETMSKIIRDAKRSINTRIDEEEKERERVSNLIQWVNGLDGSADDFNNYIDKMIKSNAKNKDKRLLLERGKEIGLIFDDQTNRFIEPESDIDQINMDEE